MPITASAKKALRQNLRRREKNVARREAYKATMKEYKRLLAGKKFEDARGALSKSFKALDKAAKGNTITKNTASRLKSRLAQLMTRSAKTSS